MLSRSLSRASAVLVCWLLCFPFGVFAQSERGTISGTVHDTSGAIIAGAKVTITSVATGATNTLATNDAGEYTAPSMPVGDYNIRVEQQGFRPAVINKLTVNAAASVRADFNLEVGAIQTAVEVQANAVQLQTEDAKTSTVITNKLVDELPLVVGGALRSPFDLAALTPEAKPLGGDNGFALGGGQAASYGTTLDGVSANTTRALSQSWVSVNSPSLEAITEFTVDTNGFKAEFGHAGGGVMTFVSKSGSNEFHGSAYEFLRNNAMDANYFFNNTRGIPIPVYKQHDFGGSFGGPVWIPKVYRGRNKTFFFTAYEGFRNRAGATSQAFTVATPEMYDGDFSKWVDKNGNVIPIYNPLTQTTDASGKVTRQPFAGNIVPKSLFDPVSAKALAAFTASGMPKPNTGAAPGTIGYVNNNYIVSSGSQVSPQTKWSIKGDHIFSEKDRINAYYGYNRSSVQPGAEGPPTLPGNYTTYNDTRRNSDVLRFSWDRLFSASISNHFYAGGNNWRENHDPPQASSHWKDKVCLGNVPNCDENLLNFDFGGFGYSSWGGRANNGSENTIYSYNDDVTWIKGKHAFKFGGMYQLSHYNGFGRQCIAGCATFSFKETAQAGDTSQATGNPFASLLLGYADGGSIDTIRFIGQQWPYFAGYFQDDWKITPKLMLNIGLRWETQLPPTGLEDRWSDFSPTRPNPKAGGIPGALIYAGDGPGREGSRSLADSYFKAFGPRVGFAYQLNDKTVIRGSYARSFAAITTVSGSTHQRGFTQTYGAPNDPLGIQPAFTLSGGFPAYPVPPFIDPSFANKDNIPWWQGTEATRPPEFNTFNLSIQRQLTSSLIVETAYNSSLGSHLQTNLLNYDQINPANIQKYGLALLSQPFDSPAAVAAGIVAPYPNFKADWGGQATVARALRPFPQYNGVDTFSGGGDHSGHSTYHSGMIRLEKRYAKGITFQTSYVFSKLLTDADSYWGNPSSAADFYNRHLEKSIGQFDVTHNFKFGGVFELPFGKGKSMLNHGIGAAVLGGWRVSAIALYASGTPVGVGTTYSLPLFNGRTPAYVTSYEGWRAQTQSGSFDPQNDRFFVPYGTGPFPTQGAGTALNGLGNVTRFNPKVRLFPNLTENLSIGKSWSLLREGMRLDFRAEAFNAFNRVRFGTGSTTLQDPNFGRVQSNSDLLNTPRQMQLALKLYF